MNFHIDVPAMLTSLNALWKGMLGIFAVILVIWGFVALLNKVTAKSE